METDVLAVCDSVLLRPKATSIMPAHGMSHVHYARIFVWRGDSGEGTVCMCA